jgi:hypothetical protein
MLAAAVPRSRYNRGMRFVVELTGPTGSLIMWLGASRSICERDLAETFASKEDAQVAIDAMSELARVGIAFSIVDENASQQRINLPPRPAADLN